MRTKLISLLILIMLLASACSPQATVAPTEAPAVVTTEAPTAEPTEAPTPEPVTLTVLAAASLTESFTEIGKAFEAENPGVTVVFNFAGSQALAEQLTQGADADVFASASKKYMTAVQDANIVAADAAKTFVLNRLVVIYPKDNPAGIVTLQDLAKAGVKLDLADQAVPVGQYSLDFLDKTVEDASFDPTFKDSVLANVVSYEENVKAVLTKVSMGEADAGIVYVSDITSEAADKVGTITIPDSLNTIATYPIAPISASNNAALAQAFVDYVLSDAGQETMAKYNFIPAANSFTVTDALDRKVTLNDTPKRIVLAGKALFMIADAIYLFPEAGDNIVAMGSTQQGSYAFVPMIDPTFSEKTQLDSSAGAEQIAASQPDLVIMKSMNAEKLGASIEVLGIPVVYVDFETAEQYKRDLITLGQIFNNPDQATLIADWYQGKVDSVTTALAGLTDDQKPNTLVIQYSEKDGAIAFKVPPVTWMQTYLIETAGGTPVWKDANSGSSWLEVNLEQIAVWNPEYVFVISYFTNVDDVVTTLKADPQWMLLDAVKNDKIFAFATDVYSWDQPDTRWGLGLNWVAAKLHPDLFPDYDAVTDAKAFYKDLYGMDDAAFEQNILPIMSGDIK